MSLCVEYLSGAAADKLVRVLCEYKKVNREGISDFELFALLCESAPLCEGNLAYADFLSCLKKDIGEGIALGELECREYIKYLWRKIQKENYFDSDVYVEKYNLLSNIKQKSLAENYVEKYKIITRNAILSVENIEKKIIASQAKHFDVFLDKIANNIEKTSKSKIAIDLLDFEYSVPDFYHSKLAFEKILNGEKCNNTEKSLILLWTLGHIILCRKTELFLLNCDNISVAKDMCKYLKKLFEKAGGVEIYLQICEPVSYELVDALVENGIAPLLNIRDKNDSFILSFASVYPKGCIQFFDFDR